MRSDIEFCVWSTEFFVSRSEFCISRILLCAGILCFNLCSGIEFCAVVMSFVYCTCGPPYSTMLDWEIPNIGILENRPLKLQGVTYHRHKKVEFSPVSYQGHNSIEHHVFVPIEAMSVADDNRLEQELEITNPMPFQSLSQSL